ncbi:MAG TPA: HD-GYP domain-containing protein [Methylomirabilota bacterium]|nr:HD-GYP domain-containing protein [Methylomirabilota bacterium]
MAQLGDLDRESEQLLFHVVRAVADATHASDPYMAGHSSRVAAYCEKIANSMGLPSRDRLMLFVAAAFHDVGYLSTPEYILRKPSVLAEDEMEEVRVHPVRGAEIFASQPPLGEIARAVRHHHERFDGSGYPEGLRGDEIPLFSRIILVAETYEAMTHHRAYRRALSAEEATRRLQEGAGSQLDPEIVKHFLAILGTETSA